MTLSVHSPFSRLDVKTEHRLVGILNQTSMKTHCWVDINLQCWRDIEFWLLTTMKLTTKSNYKIRCQRYFDVRPRPDIEFWSPNITTLVVNLVGSIPSSRLGWLLLNFSSSEVLFLSSKYSWMKHLQQSRSVFFPPSSVLFRFQDLFFFSKSVPWRYTTPPVSLFPFLLLLLQQGREILIVTKVSEDLELNSNVFRYNLLLNPHDLFSVWLGCYHPARTSHVLYAKAKI